MQSSKKFLLLILALFITSINISYAQSIEDLENQAKALGLSDQQIADYKKMNLSDGSLDKTSDAEQNITIDRTRVLLEDAEKIEAAKMSEEVEPNKWFKPQNIDFTRFGSDIFNGADITFEPDLNIATPLNYRLAAGDEVFIDIWGDSEEYYQLIVSPEGTVVIPELGPVRIGSLSIEEAKEKLRTALSTIYAGIEDGSVNVDLSLGKLRSIRVNVVGEALMPGTYTLPSLSTLFNVLYSAGGVNNVGSLRDIKLYREGELISTLDVYDFIVNGNNSSNIRLEENDLVVIEPYQSLVATVGALKRPIIYELKEGETIDDLLKFSGGFRGDAFKDKITVSRKNGDKYAISTVASDNFSIFTLNDGDLVEVGETIAIFENRVTIMGAVWREGNYEITPETQTLSELVKVAGGLKGDAYPEGQLKKLLDNFTYEIISFNIKDILNGAEKDIILTSNDNIYIPSIYDIKENSYITVKGEVNTPRVWSAAGTKSASESSSNALTYKESDRYQTYFDFNVADSLYVSRKSQTEYQFENGMTLFNAIILAGGLKESAAESRIIVSRRVRNTTQNSNQDYSQTALEYIFKISKELSIENDGKDFLLEPYDIITVHKSPSYNTQKLVTVKGEVVYPGQYTLTSNGERISNLIARTDGFTPLAYVKGAKLIRQKTQDELDLEKAKLFIENDVNVSDTASMVAMKIESTYSVGIDLVKAMENPGSSEDIILRENDIVNIPVLTNTVKISGGVLFPNTVSYAQGKRYRYYLNNAGGYVKLAKKNPYVIYMNGTVSKVKFKTKIEPGSEIVIPVKPQKITVPLGVQGWVGISSSIASIALMVSSIVE